MAYKRPQLVAEAFRGLPYRLTMIGVGPLEAELRRDLPPNVELRGWLPRTELARALGGAEGFVHAAEEDFGIATVEALAAGTPVVALARGGSLDVVRDGTDGVLVPAPTVEALRAGIRMVAEGEFDRAGLRRHAEEFGRDRFVAAFGTVVATALGSR